jgi:hypothetical protein
MCIGTAVAVVLRAAFTTQGLEEKLFDARCWLPIGDIKADAGDHVEAIPRPCGVDEHAADLEACRVVRTEPELLFLAPHTCAERSGNRKLVSTQRHPTASF